MTSKKYAPIVLLSTSLMAAIPAHADSSTTSKVGDVLAFAIPAAAYGSTYYMDDKEGRQQFYYSFATNVATTQVLKSVTDKERPNGRDEKSFPSGHTSMAFQGASFIHKRYGLEYSIPAYIGAGFVARPHHAHRLQHGYKPRNLRQYKQGCYILSHSVYE